MVQQITKEAQALKEREPEKSEELDRKVMKIQQSFFAVQAPLQERKKELDRKKRGKQFLRDIEDELLWINEKLPLARDPNYGETLNEVQLKQKKFRVCFPDIDTIELDLVLFISHINSYYILSRSVRAVAEAGGG